MTNLAKFIDHTLLKADATEADIRKLCEEALTHHFFGVCVNSVWIPLVREMLKASQSVPVAVVGFPLGAAAPQAKGFETRWAVQHGAKEIDTVINLGFLRGGNDAAVEADLREVVNAAQGAPVKVILETHLLSQEEKIRACKLAEKAGASFVKTSTGFSGGGATIEDVRLMRLNIAASMQVKASGGIRSAEDAWKLIDAGATRLGTSSGVALLQGQSPAGVKY